MHLAPFFGDHPLSKITSFDIERYKFQGQKEAVAVCPRGKTIERPASKITPAKPSTINCELAVLSHLFNKAIEWGWSAAQQRSTASPKAKAGSHN